SGAGGRGGEGPVGDVGRGRVGGVVQLAGTDIVPMEPARPKVTETLPRPAPLPMLDTAEKSLAGGLYSGAGADGRPAPGNIPRYLWSPMISSGKASRLARLSVAAKKANASSRKVKSRTAQPGGAAGAAEVPCD